MNLWNIKTTSVHVERFIKAAPLALFDAWLDPQFKGSPWSGVTKVIIQPHVDGLFYRMHPSDSHDFELAHYGRFLAVDRPSRIQHTWVSQHTRGLESVVSVQFEAKDDGTGIVIEHIGLPDDEMGRMHEAGWSYFLTQLAGAMTRAAKK